MARKHTFGGDPWQAEGPLTERLVAALTPPSSGSKIRPDGPLPGFGVRVTSAGARSYVLRYRNADVRDRTLTIGDPASWRLAKAKEQAKAVLRQVDAGGDPLTDRQQRREAPTVNDLCDRFKTEHMGKLRPGTVEGYLVHLKRIRLALGKMKVADVRFTDIDRLHREIAKDSPYAANRCFAVLSKMFNLAMKWEMRPDHPAKGVERCAEQRRERFLGAAEIARLAENLAAHPERVSAAAIKLLLLTGARRNEVLSATWEQFDLAIGVWIKPAASTKQRRTHRIPLNDEAIALLIERKTKIDRENVRRRAEGRADLRHVFPGGVEGKPLMNVKRTWQSITKAAALPGVRLHDLRHSYASILASSGLSLPIIGALLGHTQPGTTARYAHLLDDPLRLATATAGRIIGGGKS